MATSRSMRAANAARRERQIIKRTMDACSGKRRGKSKVLRNSYLAGDREKREWRAHNIFGVVERDKRIQAIEEWNYGAKQPGKGCGPLGYSDVRVLRYLMGVRDFKDGRCDPAYSDIATALRICFQTVSNAIKRLTAEGLLGKLRRTRPKLDAEPDGPQVEQISNAYWFTLPKGIMARVRQLLCKGGKPVDQEQREREEAEQIAAMIASLTAEEAARFYAGDQTVMAAAIASFGRAVDRQTSATLSGRDYSPREGLKG